AAIYLVNGSPSIAYQDGLTADVYVAAKSGAMWSLTPIANGPTLDGFSIAATTAHGGTPVLAWDVRDPNASPVNDLVVQKPGRGKRGLAGARSNAKTIEPRLERRDRIAQLRHALAERGEPLHDGRRRRHAILVKGGGLQDRRHRAAARAGSGNRDLVDEHRVLR